MMSLSSHCPFLFTQREWRIYVSNQCCFRLLQSFMGCLSQQGEFVEPGEAQDVADVKFRPSLPRRVKQYPYNISSSVGLVDSHCHLDFLFRKMSHVGSFALFRQRYQSTFPDCYEGCVAVFCDPSTFNIVSAAFSLPDMPCISGKGALHLLMCSTYLIEKVHSPEEIFC